MKKILIILAGIVLFIFGAMICIGTTLDINSANPEYALSTNITGIIFAGAIPILIGGYITYLGFKTKP